MVDIDEIPEPERGVSRRSFVKGAMLVTAGVAAAGTVGAVVNSSFITKQTPSKKVNYIGSTLVSGPAPQGIPILPLKLENGIVMGDPAWAPPGGKVSDPTFTSVLEWYKFCGRAARPGYRPDYNDSTANKLQYFVLPEKLASAAAGGIGLWFESLIGNDVRPEDFREVGYGAGVSWRSQGQSGLNIITAMVIRQNKKAFSYNAAAWPGGADDFRRAVDSTIVDLGDGTALVAYISTCKHFCCTPGWRESPLAQTQGFWSKMFCTCHFSVYDPVQFKADFFIAEEA